MDIYLNIEVFEYHKDKNALIASFAVMPPGFADAYESIPKKITVIGKRHNREFLLVSKHKLQHGFELNKLFPGSFYWLYVTSRFYENADQFPDEYAVVLYTKE